MNGEPKTVAGDQASYYFHQGTNYRAYEYMGVHLLEGGGYVFRVWAPNALSVAVVGDFCGWDGGIPMSRITDAGIWEKAIADGSVKPGDRYKFAVTSPSGTRLKADPYARSSETLKKTASVIPEESCFNWTDNGYLKKRAEAFSGKSYCAFPVNIYEMHLGSWKTRDGKTTAEGENYLNYREIADELAPYLRQMGYTHAELMPVAEHPFDGSWGYQICGYYAPTSRFGTPDDFRYFINKLHEYGIGVILDWVPAHFPKDAHGLYEFDGGPLYEYQGRDRMEHEGWGTRCFDVGRNEVQSFLVSNALYWLREFHADGLRADAVASMLYLDYDKKPGEWIPNRDGSNKNSEAVAFFKKLNCAVLGEKPDVLMIAEESGDWQMITTPVHDGGLGFSFKWDMGFANDMFDYVSTDPIYRKYKHDRLTFSMMYAFNENYILPVSHDEVVHGKKSLLDKMWGDYEQKFSGMRLFWLWMMSHPGKKMTFMGCEYAPFREWDYENQLEWFMLGYEKHRLMQLYVAELNAFYLASTQLWERDFSWKGFEWIFADMKNENLIAFRRLDAKRRELVFVLNFSGRDITLKVPVKGAAYSCVFDTEDTLFGGQGRLNEDLLCRKNNEITVSLRPLSGICLRRAVTAEIKRSRY